MERNNQHYTYYDEFSKNCVISNGLQGVPKGLLPYVHKIHDLFHQNTFNISEDQTGIFSITCEDSQDDISAKEEEKDNSHENNDKGNHNSNIETFETAFSTIRYLTNAEVGNFTVSFGDSSSYPFCTCSYWNTYKFPCVHMAGVFCNIPGWRFHMLSPLYRFNPVIDIDYSSIYYPIKTETNDEECQTCTSGRSIGTQMNTSDVNIFEHPSNIPVTESLVHQAKGFLEHLHKTAIIFKDKVLHNKLHKELQNFIVEVQTELTNKAKLLKSLNFFSVNVKNRKVMEQTTQTNSYTKHMQTLRNDLQPSVEINEKVTKVGKVGTIPISTKDIWQSCASNIPDKRPHYTIVNPMDTYDDQVKRRKLCSNVLTDLNEKKVSLPVLVNILKDNDNDLKIKYGSKPVLPPGMITLAHLTGKNKIQPGESDDKSEENPVHKKNESSHVQFSIETEIKTREEYVEDNVNSNVNSKKALNIQIVPSATSGTTSNVESTLIDTLVEISHSQNVSNKVGRKPCPPDGAITLAHLTGKTKYTDVKEKIDSTTVNNEFKGETCISNEVKKGCG